MKLDNPLLTLSEIQQRLLKPKSKHSSQSCSFVASACGLVIDASNYLAEAQKITLIDHANQQLTLDVLLQGTKQKDFAVELEIGDIVHIQKFVFIMHEGKLTAYKAGEKSKMVVIAGYREDQMPEVEKNNTNVYAGLTAMQVQIRFLRKFGYKYFQRQYVPLKNMCQVHLNPEQIKKQNKIFDIIAKVVNCQEVDHAFRVTMTDQRYTFFMDFSRHIQIGVYKVRGIPSIKITEGQIELIADFSTNFLKIHPWMRSYNFASTNLIINRANQPEITTRLLGDPSKLPTLTLKQLIEQTYHLNEVIVNCVILEIDTPFVEAFKKLTIQTQDNHSKYSELHYKEKRGILITKVHLVITDASMKGETMTVYLYPFDGRGREFMPELDPFEIRERIESQQNAIELKYFQFVNNVLEKTSFETNPLKLILSPMCHYKRGTVYRIVDTQLIMNC